MELLIDPKTSLVVIAIIIGLGLLILCLPLGLRLSDRIDGDEFSIWMTAVLCVLSLLLIVLLLLRVI